MILLIYLVQRPHSYKLTMDGKYGISILCLLYCLFSADAANKSEEQLLFDHLFSGYNKFIRPGGDSGAYVNIDVYMSLHRLTYLDAESQASQNVIVITAKWKEKLLSWTPSRYGDIHHIVLPSSEIWLPDFGVQNSAEKFYDISEDNFRLQLKHNGLITWSFRGHVTTECKVVVDSFPFDEQLCDFSLANWMYDQTEVTLSVIEDRMDISDYSENAEWMLIDTKCESTPSLHKERGGRAYSSITCKMLASRRPTYYVINLFLPSYLMLSLLLASFCLPPGHRAVVPLQMTTLLIYSVLLFRLSSELPHTSDVPHIASFAIVVIIIATLSVISTVIISVMGMYADSKTRVPRPIRSLAFSYLARFLCLKTFADEVKSFGKSVDTGKMIDLVDRQCKIGNDCEDKKHDLEEGNTEDRATLVLLSKLVKTSRETVTHLKAIEENTKMNQHAKRCSDEWKLLSKVAARSCFCLFLIAVLGLSIEFALAETSPHQAKL